MAAGWLGYLSAEYLTKQNEILRRVKQKETETSQNQLTSADAFAEKNV